MSSKKRNGKLVKKCLTNGCKRPVGSCGLCDPCRAAAYRAIRKGITTRRELEAKGYILPARRGRRKSAWAVMASEKIEGV